MADLKLDTEGFVVTVNIRSVCNLTLRAIVMLPLLSIAAAEAKTKHSQEKSFQAKHCKGQLEHKLPNKMRVDCLTDTHAIEYNWGHKWSETIGRALYYSAITNKKAGIVLIMQSSSDARYLERLVDTIQVKKLDIDVWVISSEGKRLVGI